MEKILTSGSVFKNYCVLFTSVSSVIFFRRPCMVWQTCLLSVSLKGVDSITAVSVGSQVMHMLTVMIVGLAMGSTVVIGKAVGARKSRRLHQ